MKEDLTRLDLTTLYDLLAQYTAKYTRMMNDGAPRDEFKKSEEMIISLQNEIQHRRLQRNGSSGFRSPN